MNQINYKGCQFDVHFIPYQTSTDILGIVNEFVQYVQNFPICIRTHLPNIDDKNISKKSWQETKTSKELLYVDRSFLNVWVYFSLG